MPLYTYRCECGYAIEKRQSYDQMCRELLNQTCDRCGALMSRDFPVPHLSTDTARMAGLGDGFEGRPSCRKQAYAQARAAGVTPGAATYYPQLADYKGDPKAWVPHADAKAYIKKRCEELNVTCHGIVESQAVEVDPGPDEPYTVAEDIVTEEVDRIVEQHQGDVTPKERADLTETTRERLSGR